MTEKTKNKPAVTKKMHTKKMAEYSLASSPRFKTIAAKVDNGELTTSEAIDMLIPKDLKGEERTKARNKIAGTIGTQIAKQFTTKTRQKASEKLDRPGGKYEQKQTRKPSFNKGGVVKANCGASMKPNRMARK